MKSATSDRCLKLLPVVTALLRDPASLRVGCTAAADGLRFVMVRLDRRGGEAVPLAWGTGIPKLLRFMLPFAVTADCGTTPVHLIAAQMGDEDPDAWIDRNEALLIPAGFTAEQIVTETSFDGNTVFAGSLPVAARDKVLAELETKVPVAAMVPPLTGLAHVYRDENAGVWFLWKIDQQGSIIGKIEKGRVLDLCHFWADTAELLANPEGTLDAVASLAGSLAGPDGPLPCCYQSSVPFPQTAAQKESVARFSPLSDKIPSLPSRFYEAFGNALYGDRGLNLLPFHLRQRRALLLRSFTTIMRSVRLTLLSLVLLALVAGSYIGMGRLLVVRDREAMVDVDRHYAAVVNAEKVRDSLQTVFSEFAGRIAGESMVTRLLSDLQEVFPEGVKVEELTVAEQNADSWRITLRAFSVSSGLMQPTVKALQSVPDLRDVRIVYSEQQAGKKAPKGIRFKIEAVWR